ncbi:hypothetical protein [Vacuolonema iberomarrocanum]|uniref:hypothetical protein n=1 Tax=Vacuolonema iberomarrocanum TaxID=3454632 RepID=UPI001A06DE74|nr:hypothetical protein [filamentous cyanobacterium LEGE 07170]
MLGQFQQASLRIEVEATEAAIRHSLLRTDQWQKWSLLQRFSEGVPLELTPGTVFTTWTGPIAVRHQVEFVSDNALGLLLSQGIDGFHHWHWGEGWIQSSLEGVSLLPLSLGHTLALVRLRQFLERDNAVRSSAA